MQDQENAEAAGALFNAWHELLLLSLGRRVEVSSLSESLEGALAAEPFWSALRPVQRSLLAAYVPIPRCTSCEARLNGIVEVGCGYCVDCAGACKGCGKGLGVYRTVAPDLCAECLLFGVPPCGRCRAPLETLVDRERLLCVDCASEFVMDVENEVTDEMD